MISNAYSQLPLVTPNSVARTIMNDGQTRVWFRKLLMSPLVIKLLRESPEGRRDYGRYRAWSAVTVILLAVTAGCCLAGERWRPQYGLVWGTGAVCAASGAVLCWRRARCCLAQLAARLVASDKDTVQDGMTLYQLGERWSRKYAVPSMVDTIWLWDQSLRRSFLVLYFMTFGVFFLPFWEVLIWTMAGCFLVVLWIKGIVLFKRRSEEPALTKGM